MAVDISNAPYPVRYSGGYYVVDRKPELANYEERIQKKCFDLDQVEAFIAAKEAEAGVIVTRFCE